MVAQFPLHVKAIDIQVTSQQDLNVIYVRVINFFDWNDDCKQEMALYEQLEQA